MGHARISGHEAATGGASPLVARLFGTFDLSERTTGAPLRLRSRKSLALLVYLLLAEGRPVGRDRLLGLLWGTRGEEQARASLRQALTELRGSIAGPALAIGRASVELLPGRITSEVDRLAALAARGDLAGLADLAETLDAAVLEGLDGIDPALDEWLAPARAGIVARLVDGALAACEAEAASAALAPRRRIVGALQKLDPADERLVRLGLSLDQQAGDHGALHRRFRTLEAVLAREYDARPSAQTEALFRKLTAVGAIMPPEEPVATPAVAAVPARRREPPVVVIQPIAALDPEQALAAQFCRGELEIALGGVAEIRLLALDQADPAALEAVAGEAVASYALRGWLSGTGETLRLKWLLSRVKDGLLVWSRAFDVPRAALGAEIAEVVAQVAGAILPAVERDLEAAIAPTRGHADPSAYELYFDGRMLMLGEGGLPEKRRAAELFEAAIARDPRLVNAHLDLARLYNTDFEQCMAGHDVALMRRRAFELCAHAVTLDPASARVRARVGWCYLRRGDGAEARRWLEEALTLSPYHAECINEVGFGLLHLGELDRAAELLARAFALNPFPRSDYFADTAVYLLLTGDHARAEAHFEIAGARALHYRALHIANRALLDGSGGEAAATLAADLRAIWVGGHAATDADLLAVLLDYLPFQRARDRAVLADGLARAGWRLPAASTVLALDAA